MMDGTVDHLEEKKRAGRLIGVKRRQGHHSGRSPYTFTRMIQREIDQKRRHSEARHFGESHN